MTKYLVLYNVPVKAMQEMMENMTPENKKKGMEEWMQWMEKYKDHFVDTGNPAGKNTRVMKDSAEEMPNEVGGYSIMQAESKEELVKILQENSHFMMPGAYIELMEVVNMDNM